MVTSSPPDKIQYYTDFITAEMFSKRNVFLLFTNLKLIFEVVLGGQDYSDTALDDMFIDTGACPKYVVQNECKDTREKCRDWARNGRCESQRALMQKFCKSSCRLCEGRT